MKGINYEKIQWLSRYLDSKSEIESISRIIDDLTNDFTGMKSVVISDMPHGSRNIESPQQKFVDKYSSSISYYIKQKEENMEILAEIEHAINSLHNTKHRTLLRNRYILGMEWDDIAKSMFMSKSNCKGYVHGHALNELKINTQ